MPLLQLQGLRSDVVEKGNEVGYIKAKAERSVEEEQWKILGILIIDYLFSGKIDGRIKNLKLFLFSFKDQ